MRLRQIMGSEIVDINQFDETIKIFLMNGDIIEISAVQHQDYEPSLNIEIDRKNNYFE